MSSSAHGKKSLRSLRYVATAFLVVGMMGWFGGFLIAVFSVAVPQWVELPLGGLDSIAVDSDGNIYCGITAYGRIQAYSANGRFLRGWSAKSHGSGLRIRMATNDNVEVFATRGHTQYTFDKAGKLLEEQPLASDVFYERRNQIGREFRASSGTDYSIPISHLFPHVVRQDRGGRETTVVSTPFYLWPFMAPLPAWLLAISGLLLFCWVDRLRKKSPNNPAPSMER